MDQQPNGVKVSNENNNNDKVSWTFGAKLAHSVAVQLIKRVEPERFG